MIKVLKTGFYSTIQDMGRFGFQEYGVPFSGVMDRYSNKRANAILGNSMKCANLEITMTGPELLFNKPTAICITGARMNPKLDNKPIDQNKLVQVSKGSILSFGKLESGFRSYLAVKEGFKTETIMNSRSMFSGITEKSRIEKDDELFFEKYEANSKNHNASIKIQTDYLNTKEIEVYKGPEYDWLSKEELKKIFNQPFSISNNNSRMAYQLLEPLKNDLKPIITSLVIPGTVQLTPSGQLIILMRDCQTTGGYPRVLQLSESAINILSQKFSGQKIVFKIR